MVAACWKAHLEPQGMVDVHENAHWSASPELTWALQAVT